MRWWIIVIETPVQKISRLEQQILIHSIIYYRLGTSIWTDKTFDTRARELKGLIEQYPTEFTQSLLYEEFKNFDWISGYDLPLYHPKYTAIAEWLVNYQYEIKTD